MGMTKQNSVMTSSVLDMWDPDVYKSQDYVVLDFETDTSHGDYGHPMHADNGILLACYTVGPEHESYDGGRVHACWGDEYQQEQLLAAIYTADFIVAHQAKYELGWLKRCGLDLRSTMVFDTALAEYVLLGNRAATCEATGLPGLRISLDMCCRRRHWPIKDPVVDIMIKNGINPARIPRAWLQGRCEQDVVSTHELFKSQLTYLSETDRLPVLFTRCLLTPVLADMEFEGMTLDPERVRDMHQRYEAQYAEMEQKLDVLTGGINWNSGLQLAELLYDKLGFPEPRKRSGEPDRTASGRRKVDKATLAKLEPETEEQIELIKTRREIGRISAALTKTLRFFRGIVEEYDCKFSAVFHQARTATHRLSSEGVEHFFKMFDKSGKLQFQNMDNQFKSLITASRPGRKIVEIDGSQLEFRIAVHLGNDEQGRKDILDPDFDAHLTSASVMHDVPYDELLARYRAGEAKVKEWRKKAKSQTFKPLYGGMEGTPAEKRWYKKFAERYSGVAKTQTRWVNEVLADKRLITPWGLQYFWPRIKMNKSGYVNARANIYNYPVQTLATGEIIPIAVAMMYHNLKHISEHCTILNTVHDSVILEVDDDFVDEVKEIGIQCFTTQVYDYLEHVYGMTMTVPLGCGITVGTHWGEGTEEAYDVFPDGKRISK